MRAFAADDLGGSATFHGRPHVGPTGRRSPQNLSRLLPLLRPLRLDLDELRRRHCNLRRRHLTPVAIERPDKADDLGGSASFSQGGDHVVPTGRRSPQDEHFAETAQDVRRRPPRHDRPMWLVGSAMREVGAGTSRGAQSRQKSLKRAADCAV